MNSGSLTVASNAARNAATRSAGTPGVVASGRPTVDACAMNSSSGFNLTIFTQPANLLGATLHHRPTPNGFSGYFPPSYFRDSHALLGLPGAPAIALLRKLGVRYVVVHPSVAATAWGPL